MIWMSISDEITSRRTSTGSEVNRRVGEHRPPIPPGRRALPLGTLMSGSDIRQQPGLDVRKRRRRRLAAPG